jgi:hypothetical protein
MVDQGGMRLLDGFRCLSSRENLVSRAGDDIPLADLRGATSTNAENGSPVK